MNYRLITAPASEPLTLSDVKAFLYVDSSDQDDYITSLITVARQLVESHIWRPLISQSWALNLDKSECDTLIKNINKAPIINVTSVTYYDSSNELQTLSASNYEFDIYSNPGRFRLKSVPQIYDRMNALQINFSCGYANANSVPTPIKQAMKMIIGHLWENRQDVITGTQVNEMPQSSQYLLEPFRNLYISAPANG